MLKKTVFLLLLILNCATAQAYDFQQIADQHILPLYRNLAQQTNEFDIAAAAYCTQPSPNGLVRLQQDFRSAFLAWQGAQHLRFGPVQYLLREHRFALWPDKRDTVSRHLRQLLEDTSLEKSDFDISQKSVAVQGFSVLELLLFAEDAPAARECLLIKKIGSNLQVMASGLLFDWTAGKDPYLNYFVKPGPHNQIYTNAAELAGQLLNSLHTELEFMQTQKLARPLGGTIATANGKRAEGWRSGLSLAALSANLDSCLDLYRNAFATELVDRALHRQIETGFERVRSRLAEITKPLPQAVQDPAQRVLLERLQTELSLLKKLVARDLTATLNLSLGFNSLDGD